MTDEFEIVFKETSSEHTANENDFVGYWHGEFSKAKEIRNKRAKEVERNVEELRKIITDVNSDSGRFSGRLTRNTSNGDFTSPVMVALVEELAGSDWIPQIVFEPEQRFGDGGDVFLARNLTKVHDFELEEGDFLKEIRKGGIDLFVKGRIYLQKGYSVTNKVGKDQEGEEVRLQTPKIVKYKWRDWETVYKNDRVHIVFDDSFTPDKLVDEFGEQIKDKPIKVGSPFNDSTQDTIDFNDEKDKNKKIGVAWCWNPTRKQYGVIIGGGSHVEVQLTGDKYPKAWVDERGEAFVPIDHVDGSLYKPDGENPITTVDRIVTLWQNYCVLMRSTVMRAKKAANPREIISSSLDPAEARKSWLQEEINRAQGVDIPHFIKDDGISGRLQASTLDIGVNNNNAFSWRDVLFDEIMISEGVNIRALGEGAPTAEQEKLRAVREVEKINKLISNNESNWKDFSLTNVYMLRGVESEFLDNHVELEDEVSDEIPGETETGTVRDVIDQIEEGELRFNIKISINNSNAKRKQIETLQKKEAIDTVATFIPESPAIKKMAFDLVGDQFPNLQLTEEDFIGQLPPENLGLASGAAAPTPELPNQL